MSDKQRPSEEEEKKRNRTEVTNRSRMWSTVGGSDDDDDELVAPGHDRGEGRDHDNKTSSAMGDTELEHRGRKRSRSRSDSSSGDSSVDSSGESESDRIKKSSKKESKKNHKKDSKSKKHKKEKKDKKEKNDKKSKHKKHKKHKRDRDNSDNISSSSSSAMPSRAINQNEFGKYGIIREENFFAKQREFEVYMVEVKGMPGIMGQSKREIMVCFKDYIEDFNTATMPHEKYYNYEAWEMNEYRQQQLDKQRRTVSGTVKASFNDESERFAEMRRLKAAAEQREFDEVKARMAANTAKQESMRRQGTLQAELQLAFKQGDAVAQKRLQRLLEPEIEGPAVKHPWA